MRGQFLRRQAAGRKARGRAQRKEVFLAEALDEQSRPAAFAMADLDIDILLAEIGRLVGAVEPQFDIRVGVDEACQPRQQPFAGHARRGAHGERGGGADAAHMLGHVRDMLDLAADHLEIALAGLGQRDVAADARGQRGAEMQLQRLDLLADG